MVQTMLRRAWIIAIMARKLVIDVDQDSEANHSSINRVMPTLKSNFMAVMAKTF